MFILELTLRSWVHAEDNRRRTLQRSDVAAAITKNDIFDFLVSRSRSHAVVPSHQRC
jgi:nuclear transcription factor Y gamma